MSVGPLRAVIYDYISQREADAGMRSPLGTPALHNFPRESVGDLGRKIGETAWMAFEANMGLTRGAVSL